MKRFFLLLIGLLALIQLVLGKNVELPNRISIDIPEGYTESEYAGGYSWTNGKETFVFVSGVDTVNYDMQKCFEKMHEYAFNLQDFVEYEKKRESTFDLTEDYVERYMYDVNNKSRIAIRTSHANDIPYIIAYVSPSELDMESYSKVVSSIKFHGSWWQRLKNTFLKAPLMIFLFPILMCFFGGILAMFISKKVVAWAILIVLYIIGWPLLKDWEVGIVFYLWWSLLIWIFAKMEFKDFVDLTQTIENKI